MNEKAIVENQACKNLIRINLKIISFMLLYVVTIFGVLGASPAAAITLGW